MSFTQADINTLLSILGIGSNNAQTAKQIATNLGYPTSGQQVKTRKLITFAIENGHLIKSSTANPKGYWITNNKKEIKDYIDSLRNRSDEISERADTIRDEWNRQNPKDTI